MSFTKDKLAHLWGKITGLMDMGPRQHSCEYRLFWPFWGAQIIQIDDAQMLGTNEPILA